jgi:DNA-binding transcriptional LysR family regulator
MESGPGRITLWAIEIFVATADEGSISAAARRLGASPSAVSQQLTNLETAVGASLLLRNTRPVALTPAGEMFRRRATAIIAEAELARAEIAQRDLSSLTRFRLGVIEDFEADVTPRLLARMSDRLKECQFLLETGASHTLIDQLDHRALDVIVAADMGDKADWAETHPILTEGFVGVAPKGIIDHNGDLQKQLRDFPLVQYSKRHHMGRQIDEHLIANKFKLPHKFELDSYHAILAMVAQGAGWTILTPLALQRARRFAPNLDVFALPMTPLERTISLTARQGILGDMPNEVADHLKDLLQEIVVTPVIRQHDWMTGVLRIL